MAIVSIHASDAEGPRAEMLTTAIELLESEGPTALRVRRIASAAGRSTIGIYSYFGSKEQLVGAVWAQGFTMLGTYLDEAGEDGAAGVVGLARRYLSWARKHPHLYSVMFQRAVPEFVVDDTQRAIANAVFDRLVNACRGSTAEPERAARAIWQYTHGVASLEITRVDPIGTAVGDGFESNIGRLLRS